MLKFVSKKIKNSLYLLVAMATSIALFTSCTNTGTVANTENKNLKHNLTLIVTSDIHAGVNDNFTLAGVYEKRKEYETKGDYTLLIDNGDVLQGGFISSLTKGEDLIDIINAAGYDILTFGNHEFDYGMDQFIANTAKLNTKYISCNFTKNDELVFEPYVIKEFDGVKFAFIGISTPESFTSSRPRYFEDENGNIIYKFCQGEDGQLLYDRVQETIDEVKAKGADYVIAVAHIGAKETSGPYRYNDIISHTSGFNLFLDGHSHDTDQVTMKDKSGKSVFRMAVGTKLSCIGVVTFTPAGTIEHELLTYKATEDENQKVKYDNVVSKIVDEKNAKINEMAGKVIGNTDFELTIFDPSIIDSNGKPIRIGRRMETNLGDLIADAYRSITGADVGLVNGGGIRAIIKKGDITINNVKNVQPFDNIVCLIEVTGQQILDALEWGVHLVPAESGTFPQVSGMTFTVDTSIESPCIADANGLCEKIEGDRRVKNLMIGGEPVDINKKYKLSTLAYVAFDNGDGYTAFKGSNVLAMGSSEEYLLLIEYIRDNLKGKIPDNYRNSYGEGRIIIE